MMAPRRVYLPEPGDYAGTDGAFEYQSALPLSVSAFRIIPGADGGVIEAEVPHIRPFIEEHWGEGQAPIRFRGRTFDGLQVTASGAFGGERIETLRGAPWPVRYRWFGSLAVDSEREPGAGVAVQVELMNLVFSGDVKHVYQLGANGEPATGEEVVSTDGVQIEIEGRTVEIAQVLNYEALLAEIRTTNGRVSTARLSVNVATVAEFDNDVLPMAQHLTELLTIATGTHVAWSSAFAWDLETSRLVRAVRRSAPLRPYTGGPPLITRTDPKRLRAFIESTYSTFKARRERFSLAAVVHAYADGLSGGFLDGRALLLGVLGEFLITRSLTEFRIGHALVHKAVGRYARPILRRLATRIVQRTTAARYPEFAHLSATAIENAGGKLNWVFEPSLRYKLRFVSDALEMGLTTDDIAAFARTRNDLAHGMSF